VTTFHTPTKPLVELLFVLYPDVQHFEDKRDDYTC